tara:strand:- start:492 stop:1067 length:576 start_codon:yes stop_codon:yes gene_type:complete
MRKVMIIGVGGIGSYLTSFLDRIGLYEITIFDDDTLEEKNLTYQNYSKEDIGFLKVNNLSKVLPSVKPQPYLVLVPKQLEQYDLVVCCADNLAVRRILYKQGFNDDAKFPWLDLRSQGRNAALISYKLDPSLMDTMLSGPEGSFSCQGTDWDGSAEDINCMHIAIAGAATQWIQRWWQNHDDVADKLVMNI